MLEKRLFLIFAAYLYGAALHIGHALYLSKTWGYYGFRFVAQLSAMLNQSQEKTVAAYPKKSGA